MNNATINIFAEDILHGHVLNLLDIYLRELLDPINSMFKIFEEKPESFPSGWSILHLNKECMRFPFTLRSS